MLKRRSLDSNFIRDERGFTLIEVVTATTILVVALIPILLMFNTGITATNKANYHSVGLSLAQERIEQLRDSNYNDISSATDAPITIDLATFNRTLVVSEPESNLKQIEVTVSWTNLGQNQFVKLTTYRSRY